MYLLVKPFLEKFSMVFFKSLTSLTEIKKGPVWASSNLPLVVLERKFWCFDLIGQYKLSFSPFAVAKRLLRRKRTSRESDSLPVRTHNGRSDKPSLTKIF